MADWHGATREPTVSDAAHGAVGEDSVLAEVSEAARLLDERRREAVRVRLVVD